MNDDEVKTEPLIDYKISEVHDAINIMAENLVRVHSRLCHLEEKAALPKEGLSLASMTEEDRKSFMDEMRSKGLLVEDDDDLERGRIRFEDMEESEENPCNGAISLTKEQINHPQGRG